MSFGSGHPSRLAPAMSLAEARELISRWLDSIETSDLTEEGFEAATSSDERLNAAFDVIGASAVEQFSATLKAQNKATRHHASLQSHHLLK